jgi:hypothetical protein
MRGVALCLLSMMFGACAGFRDRPTVLDARSYYYADNRGLSVSTTGAYLEQPMSARTALQAQFLVDHIKLEQSGHSHVDDAGQLTGHKHDGVDATTSASVSTTRGLLERETRYEPTLGIIGYTDTARGRLETQAAARVSIEPDYRSYAARLRASWEIADRGLTITTLAGAGHDESLPRVAPPGEASEWPASNERVNGGLVVSRVLTSRIVVGAGAVLNAQFGRLESPYRRAQVQTSLFPERLPSLRLRSTSFAMGSLYLGFDTALHVRTGLYADDWGVLGVSPEVALSKQLGDRGMLTARYRFYRQSSARFYALSYDDLDGYHTGDARLGRIREHEGAADTSVVVIGERGSRGAWLFVGGYGLLSLDYLDREQTTWAHVASLGVSALL